MRTILKLIAVLCPLAYLVSGCGETGQSGPAGPKLSGTISGLACLVEANGAQPVDKSGITVSVDGTSLATVTDSSGKWSLGGVETGIYTISLAKAGYGMSKITQFQFTGGGEKNIGATAYLCRPPAYCVDSLWQRPSPLKDTTTLYVGVAVSDTAFNGYGRVLVFISGDTSVSVDPQNYLKVAEINTYFTSGTDTTNLKIQAATLLNAGFVSGDTVYLAAYAANAGTANSGYLDLATGRTVFTNLNAVRSNVLVYRMP